MRKRNQERATEYQREWRAKNREASRVIHTRWRHKQKREVLEAYGGACACCAESRFEFLTIDHIDGNGAQERREQGHRGGIYTYMYLKANGYPAGYRVLCWNCNSSYGLFGYCPHQTAIE